MSECRHCHQDLSKLPREANVFRHQTGLCAPSRNEVDVCLLEISEAEKKRTRRALAYVNAERPQFRPSWRALLAAMIVLGLLVGLARWWGWL